MYFANKKLKYFLKILIFSTIIFNDAFVPVQNELKQNKKKRISLFALMYFIWASCLEVVSNSGSIEFEKNSKILFDYKWSGDLVKISLKGVTIKSRFAYGCVP